MVFFQRKPRKGWRLSSLRRGRSTPIAKMLTSGQLILPPILSLEFRPHSRRRPLRRDKAQFEVQGEMNRDLPTFSQGTLLPSLGRVAGEPLAGAKPQVAKAEREVCFQNLGIVLERLWMFYEAMRSGKAIGNSDKMLAEMRGALTKARPLPAPQPRPECSPCKHKAYPPRPQAR